MKKRVKLQNGWIFDMDLHFDKTLAINYKFVFKDQIREKVLRYKIAITLAVVTAPWTFLLPTKWLY